MKADFRTYGKYLLFIVLAVCATGCLLLLANAWLGSGIETWFQNLFFRHSEESYTRLDGTSYKIYGEFLRWDRLKILLLILLLLLVLFWAVSFAVAIAAMEKKRTRRAVENSARLIREIFSQKDTSALLLPKEYEAAVTCGRDLRARMTVQEQALQQEAAQKNDLIAYLAHDLKTPLTSVVGYLSLLEEAPDMPPEQKAKYVRITLDKALRLEKLINELFEITRYNLHEIVLEPEIIDLSYMLAQLTDEFYPVLRGHGNTVRLDTEEGLTVTADPDKLARVFNNILKNAIAYSYPDTPITIQARRQDGIVRVSFSNSGRTIPQQKLTMIFDKFYRLDDARSSGTGGSGLGLAIAKEIVAAHHGSITAASENQVTTFLVELPA
ncbi:MAG: sensor histidine kinase [Faecousia sp.]